MMNDNPELVYIEGKGSVPKKQNPLDIRSVRECKKCVTLGAHHVPSFGNPQAEIMIIGVSPNKADEELARPFMGSSGELLEHMLDQAGVDRDDVYMAYAIKCRLPGNRSGHPVELINCFKTWLLPEIQMLNPRIVVLLGKVAHTTVLPPKFPFTHGGITRSKYRVYLTLWNPGYFLRNQTRMGEFVTMGDTLKELVDEIKW